MASLLQSKLFFIGITSFQQFNLTFYVAAIYALQRPPRAVSEQHLSILLALQNFCQSNWCLYVAQSRDTALERGSSIAALT
jgi:hypothetical protein